MLFYFHVFYKGLTRMLQNFEASIVAMVINVQISIQMLFIIHALPPQK